MTVMANTPSKLRARLTELGFRLHGHRFGNSLTLLGCNDNEIADIATSQGVNRLPRTYIDIMVEMGKSYEAIYRDDTIVDYPEVCELKEYAILLLTKAKATLRLKDSHFVFAEHSGDVFSFFDTEEDNDPIVLHYFFGSVSFQDTGLRFSEYMLNQIDIFITYLDKYG
jgi:hypothetical protein